MTKTFQKMADKRFVDFDVVVDDSVYVVVCKFCFVLFRIIDMVFISFL